MRLRWLSSSWYKIGKTNIENRLSKIGSLFLFCVAVDFSGESGIIKAGSGFVALENQRYGRNKNTLVNKTYIGGGEYK